MKSLIVDVKLWIAGLGLLVMPLMAQEKDKRTSVEQLTYRVGAMEQEVTDARKLKVGGYIQTEWQLSQIDSSGAKSMDMKVGQDLSEQEKFSHATSINRLGIRRGRINVAYESGGNLLSIQFDLTEAGLSLKDAYVSLLDPWKGYAALKAGLYSRPFGFEVPYSSAVNESPERSRVVQTLFPEIRDLGASLVLFAPKACFLSGFKWEAGLFAGNGISKDNDSRKDLITHLSYSKLGAKWNYAFGASYYQGSLAKAGKKMYTVTTDKFVTDGVLDSTGYAKRQYFGLDAQVGIETFMGHSSLRAEYFWGVQPGSASSSSSPSSKGYYAGGSSVVTDLYSRNFLGGYLMWIQDLGTSPHSILVKYDWYDPNTDLAGSKITTASSCSKADMAYTTLGLGYMYRFTKNVRFTAYYDMIHNESTGINKYKADLHDNLCTLRVQYRF